MVAIAQVQLPSIGNGDRQRLLPRHSATFQFEAAEAIVEQPIVEFDEVVCDCRRHASMIPNICLQINAFLDHVFVP